MNLTRSLHPIDQEFELLRAAYAEEEAEAVRGVTTVLSVFDKSCFYCGGPGVFHSGTWQGFCSSLCCSLYDRYTRKDRT